MDFPPLFGLSAVILLVLANGFFVATEFAIVAVRKSRLEELVEEGRMGATAARDVVAHLDAYIAATQFGITLASLALGWVGEPALAHLIEPMTVRVMGQPSAAAAHGVAIGVAFFLITGLHIVVGELAPKGLALQRPEATSLIVARPIQLFHAIFKWPVTALNGVGNATLRLLGLEPATGHEMVHSVEELRLLVIGMQKAGVVDQTEARLAQRAFDFSDLTASSLMTPRVTIDAVPSSATLDDLWKIAQTVTHTRLPVYEGTIDSIIGYFHVRRLLRFHGPNAPAFSWREILQTPIVVPETRYASDLLEDMRRHRSQMAVVVDEYGGTAGIITLADLLQTLVGRIDDSSPIGSIDDVGPKRPDGSVVLDGLVRRHEFEELAGIRLEDGDYEGVDTVGGLVVAILGRFPAVGERVEIAGRELIVEALDGPRVDKVRLLSDKAGHEPPADEPH